MNDSLSEIGRLSQDFYHYRAETNTRLNNVEKNAAVESVHRINVEKRLGGIEDSIRWVIRILVGAVLSAAMAFALSGGFSVG